MRAIRIEPISGRFFLIDVTCDCGLNCLRNKEKDENSFKHEVTLGDRTIVLICDKCNREHKVAPQKTHFHVQTIDKAKK